MPRVTHVKNARKDNPVCKVGESYYWWKFRYGGKHYSLTPPKASQLTQSVYLGTIYDSQEMWENINDPTSLDVAQHSEAYDGLVTELNTIAGQMEECGENLGCLVTQYEESADNMEEYFSGSEKVDTLRECGQECEATCDNINEMMESVTDAAATIEDLLGSLTEKAEKDDVDVDEELVENIESALNDIQFDEPNWDFHNV